MISANSGSVTEAAAVAVLGGVFGAAVGGPLGLAVPLGVVGAANGVISGWRRIYDWSCSNGFVAFTLDSTWAMPMTAAGLFTHGVAAFSKKSGFDLSLSTRQNRHVYRRGFMPRRGFAITVGNVISGAGDTSLTRRQRLVTDHENIHVWQARWFGPLYPILYGGWMLVGGAVGMVVWLVRRRSDRFTKVVESCAYYINPFEWWAYSRADHWPPSGKVPGLGWRHPAVSPLR
jgi:hypothetical protein